MTAGNTAQLARGSAPMSSPDPADVTYCLMWFLDRGIDLSEALELARAAGFDGTDEELLVDYGNMRITQENN